MLYRLGKWVSVRSASERSDALGTLSWTMIILCPGGRQSEAYSVRVATGSWAGTRRARKTFSVTFGTPRRERF